MGDGLATDFEVNLIVKNYLLAKRIPLGEKCPDITRKLLDEAGLIEHTDVLIGLEYTYHEEQRVKDQQKEIKQKQQSRMKRNK